LRGEEPKITLVTQRGFKKRRRKQERGSLTVRVGNVLTGTRKKKIIVVPGEKGDQLERIVDNK